ncbi:MAG: prolipoprotein diacylglyceryl transferase [Chloroflexota bacterium]
MLILDWNPIAFTLGDLTVRWYGIMVALAVIAVLVITMLEARRKGISEDLMYGLFVWGMLGGLIVSRLVHVLDRLILNPGEPFDFFSFAGLGLWGAVLGVPLAAFIYTRVHHIPWSSMARIGDAVALGAPIGQAIGRVGCFLNGCCHGAITDAPWAVMYDHPNTFCTLPGVPVHPTQLYLLAWNLVVFGVVFWMRKKPKPDGSSFLVYLGLYAVGDLLIRFWRINEVYVFGLQQGQLISLAILIFSVVVLVKKWRNYTPPAEE